MIIFLILGVVLGAVTVVFALQNIVTVTVVFMSWQLEGSLAIVILSAVLMGALISFIITLPGDVKRSLQISGLKKQNAKLQAEIENKKREVEVEKSKLVANNAYLDDLEKRPQI
jgi:uncharacterized integral membrane protein